MKEKNVEGTIVEAEKNDDGTIVETEKETVTKEKTFSAVEKKIIELGPKIAEWKKEYGKIFSTSMDDGEVYIWRRLKRKEYVKMMIEPIGEDEDREQRYYDKQDLITKNALLYPDPSIVDTCAGVAAMLSDEIIMRSGFGESDTEEL